jgi:GNAT superfamily N-acetyltransferase
MDDSDMALRRRQLGEGLAGWATVSGSRHHVDHESWTYLSGLGCADLNMALVHGHAPESLAAALDAIDGARVPALVFFAGAGRRLVDQLGAGWMQIDEVPFMIVDIALNPSRTDTRVRRATHDDIDTVTGMWADAFDIQPEACRPVVDASVSGTGDVMALWVLEEGSDAVSTVTTSRVGDATIVLAMATPARFARQGFGRSLLNDVMTRTGAQGAEVGLLLATPAGKPLYDATGWAAVENWATYTNLEGDG